MRALIFRNHQLALEPNYPQPELMPGEALVRVRQVGICQTDVEITRGYLDFEGVLGHEFVGAVERVGHEQGASTPSSLVGKRVVGEINAACGRASCDYC